MDCRCYRCKHKQSLSPFGVVFTRSMIKGYQLLTGLPLPVLLQNLVTHSDTGICVPSVCSAECSYIMLFIGKLGDVKGVTTKTINKVLDMWSPVEQMREVQLELLELTVALLDETDLSTPD